MLLQNFPLSPQHHLFIACDDTDDINCMLYAVSTGMEVAAALTDKAHSVSVIGIESVPFKKALGEKVGKAIMKVGTWTWSLPKYNHQ